jgi:hypothetical protein
MGYNVNGHGKTLVYVRGAGMHVEKDSLGALAMNSKD